MFYQNGAEINIECTAECNENHMPRPYTLKRRAEQQAETRRRIVEATVALHGSLGPARTTFSMIAERAGVQRHTLYAHFPEERDLFMACSGLAAERDPPPEAAAWPAGRGQLRLGLGAIYGWYARNEDLIGCVLRDAETHALTREITTLRFGPTMRGWEETLGSALDPAQRAVLRVMLGFPAWRSLARESNLAPEAAAAAAGCAIERAAGCDGCGGAGPLPQRPDLL